MSTGGIDFRGIAELVGAAGVFIVSVGTFVMQIFSYRRADRRDAAVARLQTAASEIQTSVNGHTDRLVTAASVVAYKAGQEDAQKEPAT